MRIVIVVVHPGGVHAAIDNYDKCIMQVERGVNGRKRGHKKPMSVVEVYEIAGGQIVVGFDVGEIVVTRSEIIIGSPCRIVIVIVFVVTVFRCPVVGCSAAYEAEHHDKCCESGCQFFNNIFHVSFGFKWLCSL